MRAALDPLVQLQMKKYDPVDFLTRITTALRAEKWDDALLGLAGIRSQSQVPKQGTLQRWVRFCDTASVWMRFRLIDSILRAGMTPEDHSALGRGSKDVIESVEVDPVYGSGMKIRMHQPWSCTSTGNGEKSICTSELLEGLESTGGGDSNSESRFPVILKERAAERQPPNHYDLKILGLPKHERVQYSSTAELMPSIVREDVPNVPGAFVIQSMLTPADCKQILQTVR
jgi:hypothetical protein